MFTDQSPPTVEAYTEAIRTLRDRLSEQQVKILNIQFSQPGRAMTSHRLSEALGYGRKIAPSNGAYGALGHLFADAVGFDPGSTPEKRRGWWRVLSIGESQGEHSFWLMRPQLAEALISSGVVDRHIDGANSLIDPDIPENLTAMEGTLRLRSHLARERSRALVAAKRKSVSEWRCEVCDFSALDTYGIDYCEVHHLVPLHSVDGTTPTRLEDLAILCANCHRIIHLSMPLLTLDQLRGKLSRI